MKGNFLFNLFLADATLFFEEEIQMRIGMYTRLASVATTRDE